MLSRHHATGREAGKAVGGGGPESEDLPRSPSLAPSRKGGGEAAMSGRLALSAALAVLALVLASPSPAAAKPAVATPYPVTVTADNGKVTIRKRPSRIVSLSPTATETLFAIGAGGQVVAVDDQSDYPEDAPMTKLSRYEPNREASAA